MAKTHEQRMNEVRQAADRDANRYSARQQETNRQVRDEMANETKRIGRIGDMTLGEALDAGWDRYEALLAEYRSRSWTQEVISPDVIGISDGVQWVAKIPAAHPFAGVNAKLIAAAPELLATLTFIADGLHRAANGGFTGAGEKWTVGKLKNLIRNYVTVATNAIDKVERRP